MYPQPVTLVEASEEIVAMKLPRDSWNLVMSCYDPDGKYPTGAYVFDCRGRLIGARDADRKTTYYPKPITLAR